MLRIACFWVGADDIDTNDVGRELVSALEQLSLDSDVVTWRIAADTGEEDIPANLRVLTGIAAVQPGATYSERRLRNDEVTANSTPPIYTQTTGFTCGSDLLMMAFAGLNLSAVMTVFWK